MNANTSIYDLKFNSIDGEEIALSQFKGKHILFVNVASECGYTPQYKELQSLHEMQKENLVIIGYPCNQFGGQEPGEAKEIATFCEKNYGVTFLLSEKIEVKGSNQHPIYKWLTDKELNGSKSSTVKWNFQKYLVNKEGQFVDVFYSSTKPTSDKIISQLK
ncbi:glutathione peroxidase [Flavobacteriales bacterium]|nr:glutathione peroxidase [Flavobacteriales bacterium]